MSEWTVTTERRVEKVLWAAMGLCILLGVWGLLIASGHLPAMPWSPIGQAHQHVQQGVPANLLRKGHRDLMHAQHMLERLWYVRGARVPAPALTGLSA